MHLNIPCTNYYLIIKCKPAAVYTAAFLIIHVQTHENTGGLFKMLNQTMNHNNMEQSRDKRKHVNMTMGIFSSIIRELLASALGDEYEIEIIKKEKKKNVFLTGISSVFLTAIIKEHLS